MATTAIESSLDFEPRPVIRLLNSIVDLCLIYGFDETCARELEVTEEGDQPLQLEAILEKEIKLQFLQIIAPGLINPVRPSQKQNFKRQATRNQLDDATPPSSVDSNMSPTPQSYRKKFNIEELGLSWDTVDTIHCFIMPEGAKIYSSNDELEPSVVPMLCTYCTGEHLYTVGLRFPRPFFISRTPNSRYYTLTPWSKDTPPKNSKLIYLPTCCVLSSKRPYFKFMKDALSGFHELLMTECEDVDFWVFLKDFTEKLFLIPSPPPGQLAVEFKLPGFKTSLIARPPRGDEHYLDIRLNLPFLYLSVDNVLLVISALLTEQNIIFASSSYPMLTYIIECFLTYISPFAWRHPISPIVPANQLELLDAPIPTLFGIHSSLINAQEVQDAKFVVIIDLDIDQVEVRGVTLAPLPKHAVDTFKQRYSQLEKRHFVLEEVHCLSHLSSEGLLREKEEFDVTSDDLLSRMFLEVMVNTYSHVIEQLIQSRIKYEDTLKEMSPEDRDFYRMTETTDMFSAFYQGRKQGTHRDKFTLLAELKKKYQRRHLSEEDSVLTMSMGPRQSLTPQLSGGSLSASQLTYLTKLASAGTTIPSASRYTTAPPSYRSSQVERNKSISNTTIPENVPGEDGQYPRVSPPTIAPSVSVPMGPVELVKLELPSLDSDYVSREAFIQEVIEMLNELQENKGVKAQCVYLRAFYHLCLHQIVKALDEFFDTLQRLDVSLVPDQKCLQSLVPHVTPEERVEINKKSYNRFIFPTRRKTAGYSPGRPSMPVNPDKKMPRKSLNFSDFLKLVQQNAIATDAESASALHRVLSQERTTTISPETFRTFYDTWKLVLQENSNVELPGVTLETEICGEKVAETVLAVMTGVRTNFGTQCTLVLTTFRLLVVTGLKTHELADFRKQLVFEKFSYQFTYFVGAKSPGIRIEPVGSKGQRGTESTLQKKRKQALAMFMSFQETEDRETFYHMIIEMQTGWKLSVARRDPNIMETAQCHVILQNTITQSGLLEKYSNQQKLKVAQKLLAFGLKDVREPTKFTVEALQYRINPCLHETERQTVECLLYIPPVDMYNNEDQGKLWIGLGNGRLKVYDFESKCFESDIKITDSRYGKSVRPSCLLLVGQNVWVGSSSRNIHILDAESVCHVSQLSYLEDAPRDLTLSENGDTVWALLLNGMLIAWDPETRTRRAKIQVPISDAHPYTTCTCFTTWRDHIWVGTNRGSISVMDSTSEEKVTELFFPGGRRRQVEIRDLAVSSEDEVWCSVYCIPRSEDSNFITVFDPHSHEKKMQFTKLDSRVSIILPVNNTMWCGSKSGKIYIFHAKTYAEGQGMPKILCAHEDFIRTMTMTDINLVISGSGSNDGYAAVWKAIELTG